VYVVEVVDFCLGVVADVVLVELLCVFGEGEPFWFDFVLQLWVVIWFG